ncbi:thiol reductant ABC exporter subunit CydD [Paenibacillus odorifer]|uniref:thiol reductant ABC exporter subunit CydD n=1 Tax=Paenibacillus TaxID=44249 RepID=UPI00096D264E|nr:thiol reductant ABC exporter subunit CydD [Paenibacillus odorifer]OMD13287.1 thiol reductant ABC exporter subunit CydD [Paenibacillus odorifer]OME28545.1 thiol reductant ABC exporter subunit CydD [Paenibacillus odorifer]OME36228.1 thiol reductant ABC exporter subunit CydD [Paenibacillus odorifer]OME42290.1 thiol reductant ABC exporter subunit CydD [Paenibacillus odorifer]
MDKNLLGYKGVKPVFLIVGFLTLVQSLSILLLAKSLAEVISALFAGEPLKEQWGTALLFLLAFLVRHACAMLMSRVSYRFAEATGSTMRREMMDKLFQLGPRMVGGRGTGDLVTLVLEGVTKFRTYLEAIIPRMVGMSVTPVLVLIYVFTMDTTSGIILTVTMPIIIVFMILIGMTARKQMDRQLKSYRTLSNHFVDSLRGLETLKFLGRSRSHSDSIATVSDRYRSATMRTLRVAFLSSFALDFFTMLSVASVAVSLGLRLVNEQMTLVTGLTILILAPEYFLPVRLVGSDFHATLDGKEAAEAMKSIIDQDEVKAEVIGPNGNLSVGSAAKTSEQIFTWHENSVLTLNDVSVKYEEAGLSSLEALNLQFKGASKIGIIGESGAGKSTLVDILGGFLHPTSGSITVNSTTVSALTDEAWRKQTSYIPQRPYIFSGTLADNIRFYYPEASMEAVAAAVKATGLSGLVDTLPHGLDEMIGGGGRSFSGGQEQRVALARALLSSRPIMLLDEPTAHLDIETEYELKETMVPLFEGKLVFLATHRLHWMLDMDIIVVMKQGQVAEIGTHQELLARKGAYYELIGSQLEGIH